MSKATNGRTRGRSARRAGYAGASALALVGLASMVLSAGGAFAAEPVNNDANTTTPIKHVVVLFDENVSFDHYFGTYPNATNTDGPSFTAAAGTPSSDNYASDPTLLTANPNSTAPQRLGNDEAWTCSQNHNYVPEQKAFNGGAMDKFPDNTQATSGCNSSGPTQIDPSVMDYYDGNTVTGEWNYAQNFAMSDNSWDTIFGPSTPGALNLISGQTAGAQAVDSKTGAPASPTGTISSPDGNGIGSINGDPDPYYDDCSDTNHTATSALAKVSGKNIGDLLNDQGVSWGWFQGGFTPTTAWDGDNSHYAVCGSQHLNIGGAKVTDYSPHHSPFEYYQSTSNPHHLAPADDAEIGHDGTANHNYDLSKFDTALAEHNLPAVSFLKAAAYQDGHASNSDPLDEQDFLVNEINKIQSSPEWTSTAIVIAYDDSDGWYDHAAPTILNGSNDPAVQTSGDQAICKTGTPAPLNGIQDRCGPGPRLPLLVVSPFTTPNTINHDATEQTSITKFIEDNWSTGRVGGGSFDERAGKLDGMFNFTQPQQRAVLLNTDGTVKEIVPVDVPVPGTGDQTAAPTPTPTSTAAASGPALASTGFNGTLLIAGGGMLVAAGVVLWLVRRRTANGIR
jgi:phospholipase C